MGTEPNCQSINSIWQTKVKCQYHLSAVCKNGGVDRSESLSTCISLRKVFRLLCCFSLRSKTC